MSGCITRCYINSQRTHKGCTEYHGVFSNIKKSICGKGTGTSMKNRILLLVVFLLFFCGWNVDNAISKSKDVFSIYLVKHSKLFYTSKILDLNKLVLDDEPLLTVDSIINYTWHSHRIAFSSSVKEGLKKREPLLHFLFVVVANDERIYWGVFKDIDDSFVSTSPAIFLYPRNSSISSIPDRFTISRAPNVTNDNDVRDDKRIYDALKLSRKLKE